jgi:hypothetical protein
MEGSERRETATFKKLETDTEVTQDEAELLRGTAWIYSLH